MDAVLRIQVKVAAREARDALNGIALGVRSIQKELGKTGSGGRSGTSSMTAGFKASNDELGKMSRTITTINRNLSTMPKTPLSTPLKGVSSRWSPAIAANQNERQQNSLLRQRWKEQTNFAKAAGKLRVEIERQTAQKVKDARQAALAQERATSLMMKQVWMQQVRDSRAAKAKEQELNKRQTGYLKQIWKEQTNTAKAAGKLRAEIERQTAQKVKDARQAALAQERAIAAYMKQVWMQQVRDLRAAKAQEQEIARRHAEYMKGVWKNQVREAAEVNARERAAERAQTAYMKQVWGDQVRAARAAKAQATLVRREGIAAAKLANTAALAEEKRASAALNGFQRFQQAISGNQSSGRGLIAWSKDLQWVGRQLNFNFTLPLVGASVVVGRWAMANEAAWTRVKKVYGDGTRDYTAELGKVRTAMSTLSDLYGIQQDQVIELAGRWAAAGATGANLAQSVNSTLRLSVLGDYEDMGAAFSDLITIQGAFKLSADEVAMAVAELNTVENMSAATMQDLTRGIALAGGAASTAGVSIEELAAQMAALVPITGSASNAGNALKTIYSRIMEPTEELKEALKELGINFYDSSYQALTGSQRLQAIADRYKDLTSSQKAYFGAIAAGDRQLNRFVVLIDAMADKTSVFNSILKELDPANATKNWERANKEIQTLLESDPRKFQILVTQIKNMLTDAVLPLIPALMTLLTMVRDVTRWIGNLPPGVQKFAVTAALLVITVGFLTQAFAAFGLLTGTLLKPIAWLGVQLFGLLVGSQAAGAGVAVAGAQAAAGGAGMVVAAGQAQIAGTAFVAAGGQAVAGGSMMAAGGSAAAAGGAAGAAGGLAMWTAWTLPAVAVIAAIAVMIGVAYLFRKQIAQVARYIWNFFGSMVKALPESVARMMENILGIFGRGLNALGRMLGMFNPFSPFLEKEDPLGSAAALGAGSSATKRPVGLGTTTGAISGARAELGGGALGSGAMAGGAATPSDSVSATILQVQALQASQASLEAQMASLKPYVDAQAATTKNAEDAYSAASRAADQFDKSLKPLRNEVDRLKTAIDDANNKINDLANAPLTGMKNMADKIFANEMAQKRLRLEILRLSEAGESYEQIEEKLGAINGDIEMLRGKIGDLRLAGAGSDILSVYEKELKTLEAQRDGLKVSSQTAKALEDQLKDLEKQGEILDLENALQFDPLLRQIEELANGVKEMSFDEIVNGIREQKTAIADLTPAYDEANRELEAQELLLQGLQDERDRLRDIYDTEKEKLDILNEAYSTMESNLADIKAQIDEINNAGGFDDLTGDFADQVKLSLEASQTDLDTMIDGWKTMIQEKFSGWNPFEGLGKKLGDSLRNVVWMLVSPLTYVIATMFSNGSLIVSALVLGASATWKSVSGWFGGLGGWIANRVGDLSGTLIDAGKSILRGFWDGLKYGWNLIAGWWNSIVGGKGFSIPDFIPSWLGGGTDFRIPYLPTIEGGKFHSGGIVPGVGDVTAIVKAGEMVLTDAQQARLFDIANGASTMPGSAGGGETRVVNFYGDLSFPNITNPDDAGRFIDNLELIAG
jgi:TP901 family phage tail tape measure protein